MAHIIAAAVGVFGLVIGGTLALVLLLPPQWVWLVGPFIAVVVLGVNITAWLVVPRVIASTVASVRPVSAGRRTAASVSGVDWSSSSDWPSESWRSEPWQSESWQSEAWSSSWDYAGGDGPDNAEGADEDWSARRFDTGPFDTGPCDAGTWYQRGAGFAGAGDGVPTHVGPSRNYPGSSDGPSWGGSESSWNSSSSDPSSAHTSAASSGDSSSASSSCSSSSSSTDSSSGSSGSSSW